MEGEKKYSPPLDITHSTGRESFPAASFAVVRSTVRGPPLGAWPMIGSNPGPTVLVNPGFGTPGWRGGNKVLFTQAKWYHSVADTDLWYEEILTFLDELEAISDVALIGLKKEATIKESSLFLFLVEDFRTKWNAATHNTLLFRRG